MLPPYGEKEGRDLPRDRTCSIQRYEALAFSSGSKPFRSHAACASRSGARYRSGRRSGGGPHAASPSTLHRRGARPSPSSAPPRGRSPRRFALLSRHLQALIRANPKSVGSPSSEQFGEQELAALPPSSRPAVDAVEQLVVDLRRFERRRPRSAPRGFATGLMCQTVSPRWLSFPAGVHSATW